MQNSNKPLVSIIIPCYNSGDYIEETLDSALKQTHPNIEIIIVDDGSSDEKTLKILKILKELSNPKIKVLFLNHVGVSNARNTGIRNSSGKYILPLDSDDKIAPTYIEKAVNIMEKDNSIGIVYPETEYFDGAKGKWNLPEYKFPDILIQNTIMCASVFRRADFDKTSGYNSNMKAGIEDYDFWLSLIELGVKVYRIPETLFYYRIRGVSRNSVSEAGVIDLMAQMFRNHTKLYADNIEFLFTELFRLRNHNRIIWRFMTKLGKKYRLRIAIEEN